MQDKDEMLAGREKIVDVNLARGSDNVMRFERAVGAANDGMQLHRCGHGLRRTAAIRR